jgi:hypothetical protein
VTPVAHAPTRRTNRDLLKRGPVGPPMTDELARGSRTFAIVVFVVAAVVGIAIAWLGITGRIGGPIP